VDNGKQSNLSAEKLHSICFVRDVLSKSEHLSHYLNSKHITISICADKL